MKTNPLANKAVHEIEAVQGEASKDVSFVSEHVFADNAAAEAAFADSVEKLMNVPGWSAISSFTANFFLYDQHRAPKEAGPVALGDFIRIELPGPMPGNWVRVVDFSVHENRVEFAVQPTHDPAKGDAEETDHFFTEAARSIFRVEREGTRLIASEIGRDEVVNNHQPEAGDRAVINTAIAAAGWLFYQKIQWKTLTDYLVHL
jgi:hypothetical protein